MITIYYLQICSYCVLLLIWKHYNPKEEKVPMVQFNPLYHPMGKCQVALSIFCKLLWFNGHIWEKLKKKNSMYHIFPGFTIQIKKLSSPNRDSIGFSLSLNSLLEFKSTHKALIWCYLQMLTHLLAHHSLDALDFLHSLEALYL